MLRTKQYNTPHHFESLFKIISSPRFLNKEGLGGNKAIFIQPYPISEQTKVDLQIASLVKRLEMNNTPALSISLYEVCISILKDKKIFEKVFDNEKMLRKSEFKRYLQSSLNVQKVIIPFIKNLMADNEYKLILIYDVDKIFPILSIVPLLVDIQSILSTEPIVFFYPGDYDNFSLKLFGLINEDNEYRAFNLNNYN